MNFVLSVFTLKPVPHFPYYAVRIRLAQVYLQEALVRLCNLRLSKLPLDIICFLLFLV